MMMDKVGLEADPTQHVRGMNSGQMQMISIARALSKSPRIIVLDEPTSALSDRETDILMNSVDQLGKQGVSFLFISHKMDEIFRIADRVTVMRDGAVIFTDDIKNTSEDRLIAGMIGRKLENMYPKVKAEIGEEVLRVEHLTVPHPTNKGQNIVNDVSFSLKRGEILGIGGLVGAGRSEALSAIFGYLNRRVKKKVFINNKEVNINSPADAIKLGLGYVTEERKQTGFIWMHSIMMHEASRYMAKNNTKGAIVNISSSRSQRSYPGDGIHGLFLPAFFEYGKKYGNDAGGDNQRGSDENTDSEGFLKNNNANENTGNWLQCAENGGTRSADEENAPLEQHQSAGRDQQRKQDAEAPARQGGGKCKLVCGDADAQRYDGACQGGIEAKQKSGKAAAVEKREQHHITGKGHTGEQGQNCACKAEGLGRRVEHTDTCNAKQQADETGCANFLA